MASRSRAPESDPEDELDAWEAAVGLVLRFAVDAEEGAREYTSAHLTVGNRQWRFTV